MIDRLPLSAHTSYAELMERLRLARIGDFPARAKFVSKTVKGRLYWYVQMPTGGQAGRKQVYVGPDSDDLRERMAAQGQVRADADERRRLVMAILISGAIRPDRLTGELITALANAGAFRLRAVLVGTVAYQVYGGLLGVRMPANAVGTQDLDIAQDFGIAANLDDALDLPLLNILRTVDPGFEAVSYAFDASKAASYALGERYRVDMLPTNRGAPRDAPSRRPTLKSDATPLQYMDFLLRETVEAALLHGSGVLVNLPTPARFAVHKLIVSRDHQVNPEKGRKDRLQAAHLIEALSLEDPFALRDAYAEARDRGPEWRRPLDQAVSLLPEAARAVLEKP